MYSIFAEYMYSQGFQIHEEYMMLSEYMFFIHLIKKRPQSRKEKTPLPEDRGRTDVSKGSWHVLQGVCMARLLRVQGRVQVCCPRACVQPVYRSKAYMTQIDTIRTHTSILHPQPASSRSQ